MVSENSLHWLTCNDCQLLIFIIIIGVGDHSRVIHFGCLDTFYCTEFLITNLMLIVLIAG